MTERAAEHFYAALADDDPTDLYEHAPCGYLSLRPDGTIVKVNRTLLTWTGYDGAELVGSKRFSDLLVRGARIYYETHITPMLLMQGVAREIALDLRLSTGGELPVLANAVLKRSPEGKAMTIRFALFDATERRAYERELLEQRRRAEASEAEARALARTLQASLFPPTIAPLAHLEVGTAYRSAGDGSAVGGDFYDVFQASSGHVVVLLGDVSGKGPHAAVLASLARHTVRTEALRTLEPAHLLRTVASAFVCYHPESYCTMVLAVFDDAEHRRATLVVGGHHRPILRSPRHGTRRVGAPGTIIGLLPDPSLEPVELEFEPGDDLLMFSDGVVEARRGDEFFGDDRLEDLVRRQEGSAADLAAGTLEAALLFQRGVPFDDIAVIATRVVP